MTERFDLYLTALDQTNTFLMQMFIFALLIIAAYKSLEWSPAWLIRPAQYLYLAALLIVFLFTTVFFSGV